MTHCPHCSHCQPHPSAHGAHWQAINADARFALAKLYDNSADAIVTDPPYAAGATGLLGRLQSSSKKYSNDAILPDIAGDSLLPEAWRSLMQSVLSECHRVARAGAHLLMFCDWRSMPALIAEIGAAGFLPRATLVWNKGRGARPQKNGFRNQSELIIWAKKSGHGAAAHAEPVYLDGVFHFPTKTQNKQHLTEKPLELMAELLRVLPPGARVVDPFQGAGTTGVAAINAGLEYCGMESSAAYHNIAVARLQEASAHARAA